MQLVDNLLICLQLKEITLVNSTLYVAKTTDNSPAFRTSSTAGSACY